MNAGQSKVMVGSSDGKMIVYSGKWPCGVRGKGVQTNSIQCTVCKKRCEKEIRRRIGIAKSAFTSMGKVLTSRDIHMTVRIKVLRCYVWSTLLYGCETWTISVAMQKKLDAFETWLYRRMLRISWKDMVTNEEVYRRMNIKQSLLVDIVRRQMSFLGHVLRKEEMEHLVVTGFIDGKRARGRQRETFLTYLGKFTNKPPMELLRLAKDRVVWSKLCAE